MIGTFGRDIPLVGVLGGNPAVQFDPRKFTWLGSPSSYANDAYLLWCCATTPPSKPIADAQRPGGAAAHYRRHRRRSAPSNDVADSAARRARAATSSSSPAIPTATLLFLAVEQKKSDGAFPRPFGGAIGAAGLAGARQRHAGAAAIRPRDPPPAVSRRADGAGTRAKTDRARALIELAELPYILSRPFVAPPGLPPTRAKALQSGFLDMQKDPQYLADAPTQSRREPDRRRSGAAGDRTHVADATRLARCAEKAACST